MRGAGTADNRAVTRCQSALTGQELGRWRRRRSLYCVICVATLKRGSITVEGWALASAVCGSVCRRRAWCRAIGRPREQETPGVGQAGRRGRAVTVQSPLHRLAIVCAIPTGAIEVGVQHLGGGGRKRGDDTARLIPCAPDFRLEHHPPGAGPRRRRLAKRLRETATRREPLTIGLCQRGPRLRQWERFLEDGCRVPACEHCGREPPRARVPRKGGWHRLERPGDLGLVLGTAHA